MINKYKVRSCFVAIKRKVSPEVLRSSRRRENSNQMDAPMEVKANDIHPLQQTKIAAQPVQPTEKPENARETTQPLNKASAASAVSDASDDLDHLDVSMVSLNSNQSNESMEISKESQTDRMEISNESLPPLNQFVQQNEEAQLAPLQQPYGESSEVGMVQNHFHPLRRIALTTLNALNIIQSFVISILLNVYHANESQ